MKIYKISLNFLIIGGLLLTSCKKNNVIVDKDPNSAIHAHFLSSVPDATGLYNGGVSGARTYFVKPVNNKPTVITLGLTGVANNLTPVNLTYSSVSGAINGTHYTAPSTISFAAGTSLQTFELSAKYSDYASGRMDTVKIKINNSSIPVVFGQDSVVYYISKYCDVIPVDLTGAYDNTINYANNTQTPPYSSSIINLDSTAPGQATGVASGLIYKSATGSVFPLNDLIINADWTDESNFKITIDEQDGFLNGSTLYTVKTSTTKVSSFSSCAQTFVLYLDFVNAATGATLYSEYKIVLKR